MIKTYVHVAWALFLGMALLFLDFVTKAYVYNILPFYDSCKGSVCSDLVVFKNWYGIDFMITLATNTGAAWGFFANFQILLLIVRVLIIGGMFCYLFFFNCRSSYTIPLIVILAGAFGNVIDFFLYGSVVDFLHFTFWGYHFPVFNFADSCITIGVLWLLGASALVYKQNKYAGI
jgi:signal peptidase II